jgi:CPA2 family monovalent cation:H+ antiporter-2
VDHGFALISTLAVALGLAFILGLAALRLRLPAIVGYLVAGILIGPATPGFVADSDMARELAEIGVMLLMFGVGLHFSFADLLAVRRIALPGAVVQITVATALGMLAAWSWGWSIGAGLVFGLSLSVASTVVLLRALEDRGILESVNGRIAVGWLVVEDLATVLFLVLLPPLAGLLGATGATGAAAPAGPGSAAGLAGALPALALTLGKLAVFVVLMFVAGRRVMPWLLWQVARTNSRELFTLSVLAAAVGIAFAASELFGVSFALGAFVAGTVLSESDLSQRAAEESLPLRDAFAVLFFVAVGMLFDPATLLREPLRVLVVIAIVMLGKSVAAFLIVFAFRYPLNTALTVSASLAQIGEFSFILAGLGVALGLLPEAGQDLVLAGALVSIALNPVVFAAVDPVRRWIGRRSPFARALERRDDPLAELPGSVDPAHLTGHVLLVGYGRVGRTVGEELRRRGVPLVVAEEHREIVERLRDEGIHAVSGEASDPAVLIQGHVARARMLVIATPDSFQARRMIEVARMLNPAIEIVVRTHSDGEAELLRAEKVAGVFLGEHELARSMARHVIDHFAGGGGHAAAQGGEPR